MRRQQNAKLNRLELPQCLGIRLVAREPPGKMTQPKIPSRHATKHRMVRICTKRLLHLSPPHSSHQTTYQTTTSNMTRQFPIFGSLGGYQLDLSQKGPFPCRSMPEYARSPFTILEQPSVELVSFPRTPRLFYGTQIPPFNRDLKLLPLPPLLSSPSTP